MSTEKNYEALTVQQYSDNAIRMEAPITEDTCQRYGDLKVFDKLKALYEFLNEIDFDNLKRQVFYAPSPQEAQVLFDVTKMDIESLSHADLGAVREIRFAHAIMGILSEVFEALDIYFEHEGWFDDPALIHLAEESGDIRWYQNLLDHVTGIPASKSAYTNLKKLLHRYGERFNHESAFVRDLAGESEILGKTKGGE